MSSEINKQLEEINADDKTQSQTEIDNDTTELITAMNNLKASVILVSIPTGLTATAVGKDTINLSWTAVPDLQTGYNIYRQTLTGAYEQINTTTVSGITFTDTGLTADTTYSYKITAINAAGESVKSDIASAKTEADQPTPTVPAVPTGLTATAAGKDTINLSWTAVMNATGYNIYRQTSTGAYEQINTTTVSGISYIDTGLTADTTYSYKITAINAAGESVKSDIASAKTEADQSTPTVPAAPTGLTSTAAGTDTINLSWSAVTDATAGYNVYRAATASGDYTKINTTTVAGITFADTELTAGTTYYYKVAAVNLFGQSVMSNGASATTQASTPTHNTDFTVSVTSTKTTLTGSGDTAQLTLNGTMSDGSKANLLGAVISYTSDKTDVATVDNNGLVTSVSTGTANIAALVTLNGVTTNGTIQIEVVPEAQSVPTAPNGLAATAVGTDTINLNWITVTGALGYNVYRATAASEEYTKINTTTVAGITFVDTGLTAGITYYYKVAAVNLFGQSNMSTSEAATPYQNSSSNSGGGNHSGGYVPPTTNAGSASVVVDSNSAAQLINQAASNGANGALLVKLPTVTDSEGSIQISMDAAKTAAQKNVGFEANIGNVDIKLPANTVDLSSYSAGTSAQANVKISTQVLDTNSTQSMFALKTSNMQPIGKTYDLGLSVTDVLGNSQAIHNFNGIQNATVTIKLSDSDIQGIDTSKLTAFYFNKDQNQWQDLGGSFDSVAKTFTFTTSHFSIYSIMVKNTTDADWSDFSVDSQNQPSNKAWTIQFDEEIDANADNLKNIYVSTDSTGNSRVVGTQVQVDSQSKNVVTISAPVQGYVKGQTYYLFIYNKITSVKTDVMNKGARVKFTIH